MDQPPEARSRIGMPGGGGAADERETGGASNADKRDDRRIHRWAPVAAGLLLAFAAVAFGAWLVAIVVVAVTACLAIWAVLA